MLRGTKEEVFGITPVDERQDMDELTSLADPQKNLVATLGIVGVELDKKTVSMLRGLRSPYGIVVTARTAGAAGDVPLLPGDVIRSLNTEPMTTLDKLRAALKAAPPGVPMVLQIQRDGKLIFVTIVLE